MVTTMNVINAFGYLRFNNGQKIDLDCDKIYWDRAVEMFDNGGNPVVEFCFNDHHSNSILLVLEDGSNLILSTVDEVNDYLKRSS